MPWSSNDADRHKKGLNESQKQRWAEIANSVLQQGGREDEAIRKASGAVGSHPGKLMKAAKRRLQKTPQKLSSSA